MRLVFAASAARDLDNIIDYLAIDNPTGAEHVYCSILTTAQNLGDFPDIGRAGRLPGTREFPLSGLPYLMVYRVVADALTIVAVFHGARDLVRAFNDRQADI